MSLTVTVRDEQTGEVQVQRVADGDYVLITASPCELSAAQRLGARGQTHQLTIRNRAPQPLPELPPEPSPVVVIHHGDPDDRAHMFNAGFDEAISQVRLEDELGLLGEALGSDIREVVAEWTRGAS